MEASTWTKVLVKLGWLGPMNWIVDHSDSDND
jgi:hypothetical protein